jgi:hypothetical protein
MTSRGDSRGIVMLLCVIAFPLSRIPRKECSDAAVHNPRALWPMIVALTLLFSGEVLGQVYPTHPARL